MRLFVSLQLHRFSFVSLRYSKNGRPFILWIILILKSHYNPRVALEYLIIADSKYIVAYFPKPLATRQLQNMVLMGGLAGSRSCKI